LLPPRDSFNVTSQNEDKNASRRPHFCPDQLREEIMKLFLGFLAGTAVGLIVSRAYILSLKATLKFYENYIHERIDRQWAGSSDSPMPQGQSHTETEVPHS
jgi:hypothetical protein